ncbi:Aste57867_2989 [Aphanomyces stellatus]|uniref:Amino acid transporter n=1 Tax=Aphanomyces stellatus TaxID=120398 RepID=A0A485KE10_9STRA|nr:hypothetical protein As57867_002980 [Aphanomyces stellatus]VFT80171.1 Aste57867_2989 [Aphanomyces stellatus]
MGSRMPPTRGEIRTDFRQHTTPDTSADGVPAINFDTLNNPNAFRHSSISSDQDDEHDSSAVELGIHGDVHESSHAHPMGRGYEPSPLAILGANNAAAPPQARAHQPKPAAHELNDEYYAYLYTIEGAWYKKLYFGIWGILIAIGLGVAFAYAIDRATDNNIDLSVIHGNDTKAIFDQLTNANNLLLVKKSWNEWVQLPGNLLIRGLQCLIVPMIFVNVTIGVADIFLLKKAKMVGLRMFGLCLLTTMLSVVLGIVLASILPASMFKVSNQLTMPRGSSLVNVALTCPNKDAVSGATLFLTTAVDPISNITKMVCGTGSSSSLALNDTNHVFLPLVNWTQGSPSAEQVFFNLTDTLVTNNIVASFTSTGSLVSLVMFAIPLGISLATMGSSEYENPCLDLFRHLNSIFLIMIGWVINFVPIAVVFLVASSFIVPTDPTYPATASTLTYDPMDQTQATRDTYIQMLGLLDIRSSSFFENAKDDFVPPLTLLIIFTVGTALHLFVLMPALTLISTRRNPFPYMKHLSRALNFGFGSGSSLAALPMAVKGIDNSQTVSHQLTRFLLPIGTGIHLDGAAFYLAANAIFLARMQANDPHVVLGLPQYLILFFTAVINSWSCPPIPHGGLIALKAVWSAMIPNNVQPAYFVWVVALDVLLDRFSTVMNILSNCVVLRIIAEQIDETYVDEQDRLNIQGYDDDEDED